MALQRTRCPRLRSGRSLRSLGSPLNARPLGARSSIMEMSKLGLVLTLLGLLGSGLQDAKGPSKRAEWPAGTPRPSLSGFWKTDCHDNFGVKIEPAGRDLYSLSFC